MCGCPYIFDSRHVVNQLGLETAIATNIAGENGTQPSESRGISDVFFLLFHSKEIQPKGVGNPLKIRRLA